MEYTGYMARGVRAARFYITFCIDIPHRPVPLFVGKICKQAPLFVGKICKQVPLFVGKICIMC